MFNLTRLLLNNNQLSGSIPDFLYLPNLTILNLHYNQLSGTIPNFLNLSNLLHIEINNNELNGIVPVFTNLPVLTSFSAHENQLDSCPDFSYLPNFLSLRVSENQMTFDDLIPNKPYMTPSFYYSPQDSVGIKQNIALNIGDTYTIGLDFDDTVTTSTYTWYKNGIQIGTTNTNEYTITNAQLSDAGQYDVQVMNSVATALTLYTRPITLSVELCTPTFTTIVNSCEQLVSCTLDTILLNNSTLTYTWDFGDGSSTVTGNNPSHTYPVVNGGTTNTYTITLITSGIGCGAGDTITQNVSIDQVPIAGLQNLITGIDANFLSCNATLVNPTYTLTVTDTSILAGSSNMSYTIDWGDGKTNFTGSTIPNNTNHQYTAQGEFPITLYATGNNGCIDTSTYDFYNGNNPSVGLNSIGIPTGCIPSTLSFIIDTIVIANNSPTTEYIISVNDGSIPDTFNVNNLPSIYYHTFDSTSCGINSSSFSDAYQIEMIASNVCGISSAIVEPIRVNKAPQAGFDILDDTLCVNQNFTFTNQTIVGNYYYSGTNSCITAVTNNWSIVPNTGYNITSGSLTDANGFSADFTIAGTYTVQLIVGNALGGSCEPDTIEKKICVVPIPQSSYTIASDFGCYPHITSITNTSNTIGSCESSIYTWTTSFHGSDCGSGSNVQFIGGSNQNSQDITLQFDSSGVYVVTLIDNNQCGVNSFTDTITVANAPQVYIDSIANICGSGTISPQINIPTSNSCYSLPTYNWSFVGGNPSSSIGENPGNIIYNSSGTYTVSVNASNVCGVTNTTQNFSVLQGGGTNLIYNSDTSVCHLTADFQLYTNTAGGTWTGINVTSNGVFSPAQIGVFDLVYEVGSGSCNQTDTVYVTVTSLPILNSTADNAVCIGESMTLNVSGDP
ncbi:MAG: PKD domain-containing protein, partial [Saprospiraceae bacterium]